MEDMRHESIPGTRNHEENKGGSNSHEGDITRLCSYPDQQKVFQIATDLSVEQAHLIEDIQILGNRVPASRNGTIVRKGNGVPERIRAGTPNAGHVERP